MANVTPLSEQEFRGLAVNDTDHQWELWDGLLVEKPPMSMKHDNVSFLLGHLLQIQLDRRFFRVNVNGGKTRYTARNFLVPDVVVIPAAYQTPYEDDPGAFHAFNEPLPFVAEVWSPSSGGYDMEAKLLIYRERGDLEIWYIHPYEHTLTAWRRQPDRSYAEHHYTGGIVPVVSLPCVSVDLDSLLARWA